MKKYTICITTFKERLNLCKQLIQSISSIDSNIDIIVAINGNNEERMTEEYRKDIISFCSQIPNCYPIVCPEFKSLAKLWNTLVIFSSTQYNVILNDDIEIVNAQSLDIISKAINQTDHELFTINGSFSHFLITKNILHSLNYFDERLIAFGEEDGDMVYRYIDKYNKPIPVLPVPGIININAHDKSSSNLEVHIDNKPRFNREYIYCKYIPDAEGIRGMSPHPVKQVIDDMNQYPYEKFNLLNRHNIKTYNSITHEY
jgi:hypothetical protein